MGARRYQPVIRFEVSARVVIDRARVCVRNFHGCGAARCAALPAAANGFTPVLRGIRLEAITACHFNAGGPCLEFLSGG